MRGLAIIVLVIHCFLPNTGKLLFYLQYRFYNFCKYIDEVLNYENDIFLILQGQQYGNNQYGNNQYGNNNNIRDRQLGGNIRCYICSSIEQANCGDPFFGSGSITAKSCNQYSTNSVHMCFKAVKWCKLDIYRCISEIYFRISNDQGS